MSTGFAKWSNNDSSNLNIRAVRFGFKKPILEVELNELQDLSYTALINNNRVNNKPNTYRSSAGSRVVWQTNVGDTNTVSQLFLSATSVDDVIKFCFGGGLEYYIRPVSTGNTLLSTVNLPNGASVGSYYTLVMKAKLQTVSPDLSDIDYDSDVDYAIDARTPSLTTTKRVILETGFSGTTTDLINDYTYDELVNLIALEKVDNLNDDTEVTCILGSWVKKESGWELIHDLQREVVGIEEQKYQMISDCVDTFGTYTITASPTSVDVVLIMLDFPIKSIDYGYYRIVKDGSIVGDSSVPINQPLVAGRITIQHYLDELTIEVFSLKDIVDDEAMWGNFEGQSWEDLLNQKWFTVDENSVPTLTLHFKPVSTLGNVSFGTLVIDK